MLLKSHHAPLQLHQPGVPLQQVAMDILGPLPETERGNQYVLVITDYFTKWTDSFPMSNMEAHTVAELFVALLNCECKLSKWGSPLEILMQRNTKLQKFPTKFDVASLVCNASNELTLDQLQNLHSYQLVVVTMKVVRERGEEWPEETQLHS